MDRYVVIHGHFYQPPRENPWLEAVEVQDSAYPYHDWNERIAAECYAPNARSRILDPEGRIVRIVNNYASMSFNVGPTLMAWLERKAPEVYRAILDADQESQRRRSGHGNAIAQPYSHPILPLTNRRDKVTQIDWGIRDFVHRFGRAPEGMWLPETAVDLETLDLLAERGIRFTILAPHQARRVRRLGDTDWTDVQGERVDPFRPYLVRLASGRSLTVFFYDGPVARGVAFERLLASGEAFAGRLTAAFPKEEKGPLLMNAAADGETYGHHHRHGDMALAYALHQVETQGLAAVTNYGEFLARAPPTHEVEVIPDTSWSCVHGVERWRSDCGCSSGGHPGWRQAWRGPFRSALDWLRDELAPRFEKDAATLFRDPWAARDDYIGVILDRSEASVDRFLSRHAAGPLDAAKRGRALRLMELQRQALLMYTSCGWFFDDISRIEAVQVLQYAGRAIHLADELWGDGLEDGFLQRLAEAPSNEPGVRNGREVYARFVRPARVELRQVAAHYVLTALFDPRPGAERVFAYEVAREDWHWVTSGRSRLAVGRVRVRSRVTLDDAAFTVAAYHLGDHLVHAGVRPAGVDGAYDAVRAELEEAFRAMEVPALVRLLDQHFGKDTYGIRSLFRDAQRRIVDALLEESLRDVEAAYSQILARQLPLVRFVAETGVALPAALQGAAAFVLNTRLRRALESAEPDVGLIGRLLEEAARDKVLLDEAGLGLAFERRLEALMEEVRDRPTDVTRLERLTAFAGLVARLPFAVELWEVQNRFYTLMQQADPGWRGRVGEEDPEGRRWAEAFRLLGAHLGVRVD